MAKLSRVEAVKAVGSIFRKVIEEVVVEEQGKNSSKKRTALSDEIQRVAKEVEEAREVEGW